MPSYIYLLGPITPAREVLFHPAFVCLSVCLSDSSFTEKTVTGSLWRLYHRFICGQGRTG